MSASKAKGTRFETACARYFAENGFPGCERRALTGTLDCGDLLVPGWVVQCKDTRRIDLPGFMRATDEQARNAGTTHRLLIVSRWMKPTSESYFVVPMWLGVDMMRAYEDVAGFVPYSDAIDVESREVET